MVKIFSVDNKNYPDAPTEAIRRVLEKYHGESIPRGTNLDLKDVGKDELFTTRLNLWHIDADSVLEWIRMGTTVATNALLERKGERTAFLITA